ncbi:MAG: glycosyltransferase [Nanoarchaeota archaeon]|nr:glycosyltransferase [Nanoarchaeota archaeon]
MKTKTNDLPTISIVMPVFNEEKKIEACLKSIREQDYPQEKIEIVFVDDDSTDKSVETARKYKIKLVRNGKHDYDIGKSLGIENSKGECIMFLDGDNILTRKDWICRIIEPLLKEKSVIGAGPVWFKYNKNDAFFDRYATLFGITDPLTIYLKKRDRLMLWEKKWKVTPAEDKGDYFLTEFTKKNMPTIGSVGFTIKKEYLLKTNYQPAFSHLDCVQDLILQGYNKYAMVKLDIIHLHSSSFKDFLGKLKRNLNIFTRDYGKRRYKWESTLGEKALAALAMATFIVPFYHSMRGYIKIRDIAWFAHPFVCFAVIVTYVKMLLMWKIGLRK